DQYSGDLYAIKKYLKEIRKSDIYMKSIDKAFLEKFRQSCFKRGVKNGVVRYLKTLRAVFNKAIADIDTNLTSEDYPFNGFEIKRVVKTKKRAVSKDVITTFRNLDLEKDSFDWHVRNFFLFLYNSRGMQLVDMAHLRPIDFDGERFKYLRRKTKKEYWIKLTAESKQILEYYMDEKAEPTDYIFPIIPKSIRGNSGAEFKAYTNYRKRMNNAANEMGKLCGVNKSFTTYVMRHAWATQALNLGVDVVKIKDGLGHESLETTQRYLEEFDDAVIDDLNDMITA
ncbi:MAG: site-specific integrase, partial [Flavobacteriales bacterium]|nr:site-specific integrase [Flavobacteriales bacterium]